LTGQADLPDAQQPDPIEAHLGKSVELGIGNIGRAPPARPSLRESSVSQTRVLIW